MTVFQNVEVSEGASASWKGAASRCLRRVCCTERSANVCLNRSGPHMLCAVVLTYCSAVNLLCKKPRLENTDKCI